MPERRAVEKGAMTEPRDSTLRVEISDARIPEPPGPGPGLGPAQRTAPGDTAPSTGEPAQRSKQDGAAPSTEPAHRTEQHGTAPGADGHATVMTVRGNLDIDSAAHLRSALDGLLRTTDARIVVDLQGLDFCDSVGLSALVDAHRAGMERGGWLRLAAPSPFLARILDVVGLSGALALYDSVERALADEPPGGRPRPAGDRPTR